MNVRGETELSGRNINTEDVSKVFGTRLSQSQKRNRWNKLVVDSSTDWHPVECMMKQRNMLMFWWPEVSTRAALFRIH